MNSLENQALWIIMFHIIEKQKAEIDVASKLFKIEVS